MWWAWKEQGFPIPSISISFLLSFFFFSFFLCIWLYRVLVVMCRFLGEASGSSSLTRDWTHAPEKGTQSLIHFKTLRQVSSLLVLWFVLELNFYMRIASLDGQQSGIRSFHPILALMWEKISDSRVSGAGGTLDWWACVMLSAGFPLRDAPSGPSFPPWCGSWHLLHSKGWAPPPLPGSPSHPGIWHHLS